MSDPTLPRVPDDVQVVEPPPDTPTDAPRPANQEQR